LYPKKKSYIIKLIDGPDVKFITWSQGLWRLEWIYYNYLRDPKLIFQMNYQLLW